MSVFKRMFGGGGSPAKIVEIAGGGPRFEVSKSQTVLESALKLGIAYPHDCTVGTCGTCRTRLVSGKVDAITPFGYTLSREELEAGYILACQALPKTDLVVDVEIAPNDAISATSHGATIIRVDDLTHDIRRVTWRLSGSMAWRAGQYMNVRWGGGDAHRSYSFAHPMTQGGSTEVSTFIRHVPGGAFTDVLFTGEPAGLDYVIDGPHGNFWLRDGTGPIICVAGGSGLAPIVALLKDAANRRVRRDCILLFGARTTRDIYGLEEIADIRSAWTASFDFWPILSEEHASDYRHGLVTQEIGSALAKLGPDAQAYMCGPPPMIDAAVAVLSKHDIPLDDIHYDKFTDASTRA